MSYLEHRTFGWALIHGAASAVLIDIRIIGIMMPCLTFVLAGIDLCQKQAKNEQVSRFVRSIILYACSVIVLTIAGWPYLWQAPVSNFIDAFVAMSHFQWPFTVLYQGEYISATRVPWHYIFVWIAISTPLVYVITFFVGYGRMLVNLVRNPQRIYQDNKNEVIVFLVVFCMMHGDRCSLFIQHS
jgi:hypothetical protein